MRFDVFLSLCQVAVDGFVPSEQQMFASFFDQVRLADALGFETAWVAESHLSCEVQKRNSRPVIPHFAGEIGLNTDILQLAHVIFASTRRIHVGSAIRGILGNGGPIAHAEAARTFLTLHATRQDANKRLLCLGFAAGRFPFSTEPYGIVPRDALERAAWPVVRHKTFREATEIFLRLLQGQTLASADVSPQTLCAEDFRNHEDWRRVYELARQDTVVLAPRWTFDALAIVPRQTSLESLRLWIGSHDAATQRLANQYMPCGVFNLSFTPGSEIEAAHLRMKQCYHADGGPWQRDYMPRTALVFIDHDTSKSLVNRRKDAKSRAERAMHAYWQAMEGTVDSQKIAQGVSQALVGTPEDAVSQLLERYHGDDRLMLWFDFFNHDNDSIKKAMQVLREELDRRL